MKKLIATTSIATAGVAALTLAHGHDAQAAEYNGGYNPQDPTSYSYSYTIDNQGNYHFTWEGNWSPERFNGGNASASYYTGYNATAGTSYTQPTRTYSAHHHTQHKRQARLAHTVHVIMHHLIQQLQRLHVQYQEVDQVRTYTL